tara:strand:+ start:1582 stop:3711 length:2130 start_codon:yes stop_codon:yes gene_type:complete
MVIKHEKHRTDIDSWADIGDDDYCYDCSKWVEATHEDCCPICETKLDSTDEFASPSTAKTAIAPSPSVSSTGDIWNRGSGYTWGASSWNTFSGAGMWSSGSAWTHHKQNSAMRLLKHKRHLDSLCKVVDPSVKHTLEFSTTSGRNMTNMRTGHIVIDGTLVEDNDDKLDVLSGIAIHEKLHVIHSKPMLKWEESYRYDNGLRELHSQLLHAIVNTVEDEYIEKQLSKDCGGFVSYIAATKKHFFDKDVKAKLEDKASQYNDILNTLLSLVRYPESIDDDRRRRHAKHIRFFARALNNALDSRENMYKCIDALYTYMAQLAQKMADEDKGDGGASERIEEGIEKKLSELKDALGGSDISGDDWKHITEKITADMTRLHKDRRTPMERAIGDTEAFTSICGATEYKPKGKISEATAKEIEDLSDSDYHETKLGRSDCINPRQTKITWRRAKSKPHHVHKYKEESKIMKPQINKLRRKIDLYGATEKLTIRNQKRGRLDKRMLHRIPMGSRELFKNTIVKDDKPIDVCLLVDESGSMGGHRIRQARRSCIALKEVLEENPKLNLWVMGHTADGYEWHDQQNTTNMTVYNSPTIKDRHYSLGSMTAKCENRDGNAILAAAGKVTQESESPMSNKLMIVMSDGAPAAINYGGTRGMEHVRDVVRGLESKGWGVIQVGFGGASFQDRMFTNHIFVDDTTKLADKVGKIIRKVIKV